MKFRPPMFPCYFLYIYRLAEVSLLYYFIIYIHYTNQMALRFYLLVALIFLCILQPQVSSDADNNHNRSFQVVKGANRRLLTFVDCVGLCKVRCSAHSRPNVCNRACGTCCMRCKCVPPGTYGNREACGKCYTDMTTHGNKPKCP